MYATSFRHKTSRACLSVGKNRRLLGVFASPILGIAVLSVFVGSALASDVEREVVSTGGPIIEVESEWTKAEEAVMPASLQPLARSQQAVVAKPLKSSVVGAERIEPTSLRSLSANGVVNYFSAIDYFGDRPTRLIGHEDVPLWRYYFVKVGRIVPPPDGSSIKEPAFECNGFGGVARGFNDKTFLVISDAHLFSNLDEASKYNLFGIELFDGTRIAAERVAVDPRRDYLVMEYSLKDVSSKVRPLKFRNSDLVRLDETIRYASPSDSYALQSGKVAKPDERVKEFDSNDLFTLKARVVPGCSGSPVIDPEGYVLAFVKSYYRSDKPEHQGVSFAIPSNEVLLFAVQELAK